MSAAAPVAFTQHLAAFPLFQGLTSAELAVVEPLLSWVKAPSGMLLLTRDQPQSAYVYLLISGAVKIQLEQAN